MKNIKCSYVFVFTLILAMACGQNPSDKDEIDGGVSDTDSASPTDPDVDSHSETEEDTIGDPDTGSDVESDTETIDGSDEMVCNGHPGLCDRRFDEILFPMTHNSFSASEYTIAVANHETGLAPQLEAGVRGFMLDIYDSLGAIRFCHGSCFLGSFLHREGLTIFAEFLENNPNEVIAFIYEEDSSVDREKLEKEFEDAGLLDRLYIHNPDAPWPTLREMIDEDTRLFVMSERNGDGAPWIHYAYDLLWDTKYTHHSTDDFDCAVLRGRKDNDLFLINHWVNTALDLPSKAAAAKSNSKEMLLSRFERCHLETGQMPNFIAVDFWEQGDLVSAVASANGF